MLKIYAFDNLSSEYIINRVFYILIPDNSNQNVTTTAVNIKIVIEEPSDAKFMINQLRTT